MIDIETWDELQREMKAAFEQFKKEHTWENRSLKDMFFFGYYAAINKNK